MTLSEHIEQISQWDWPKLVEENYCPREDIPRVHALARAYDLATLKDFDSLPPVDYVMTSFGSIEVIFHGAEEKFTSEGNPGRNMVDLVVWPGEDKNGEWGFVCADKWDHESAWFSKHNPTRDDVSAAIMEYLDGKVRSDAKI